MFGSARPVAGVSRPRCRLSVALIRQITTILWELYIQLTQIEEAFRNLKGDLALRPIYHQLEKRIEAHILVAFIAYCLRVTLRRRLHKLAPGLTPRNVLEKFKSSK